MDKQVQKFREHNNSLLPRWYKWEMHLLLNLVLFVFFLGFGLVKIDFTAFFTPLWIILSIIGWGIIEYSIHRFILHGNVFNFLYFKKEHTVYHHTYFDEKEMDMSSMHDLNRTLLRPIDIFSVLCLNFFLCMMLSLVTGKLVATYFYLGGVLYLVLYELLHFVTHYYKGNSSFLNSIKKHHRVHHQKATMNDVNFAVVFPFIDTLFKTSKEAK